MDEKRLSALHGKQYSAERYSVGNVEGERLMLQSGGNGKTVSERLGHASTAFTMDVYAASVPALEEETAAKVAALLD